MEESLKVNDSIIGLFVCLLSNGRLVILLFEEDYLF